ncbi:efflux RND transporter periplasmic adaptor subunit, partial [Streptomyces liangshanensis]|uniref:hypothetical protein n=1 Tax=Streptomyces liangshanensis TaxID=2717324 RepID=UPI0036DCF38B
NLRALGYDIGTVQQSPVPRASGSTGGAAPGSMGDTPMFRVLDKPDVSGRDVSVLADNLRALGYDIGTVQQSPVPRASGSTGGAAPGSILTSGLLGALKRWQRDTGQQQTGVLDPARVQVLPGPVRISGTKAQLGDPATGDILTVTSEAKSITVKVDATDAGTIHQGDRVTITLPDTSTTPGKVASVGQSVTGGGDDPSGTDSTPTLQVAVVPTDPGALKNLQAADVQVEFTNETRKNVLVVPVGALLALQEGGYAVQTPAGKLLGVKTGLFAKGLVEIEGQGIDEGARVVTTS